MPKPADWPQWQGPDRTAVSHETGLLQDWPKDGPPLKWQAAGLGEGYSTPSVAAGRIFTMSNRGREEFVIALAEGDGHELWATELGPAKQVGEPGPRCTPTVDGDRAYALGVGGDLICLDAATGKVHWRKDLVKDFGGRVGGWGYSESPLIDHEKLICTPGGSSATLVAHDLLDQIVDLRGQGERPVHVVLVALLSALLPHLGQPLLEGVRVVGHTEGQGDVPGLRHGW